MAIDSLNSYEQTKRLHAVLATLDDDAKHSIENDAEEWPSLLREHVQTAFVEWMHQIEGDVPDWAEPWREAISFCAEATCWVVGALYASGYVLGPPEGTHHED